MTDNTFEAVRRMPKIELHRHLEGSLRLETLVEIALENKIPIPKYDVESLRPLVQVTPDQPKTPQNFLSKFNTLRQFYLSPEIIKRLTREVIIDAANDNVKYMELRFTPKTLCKVIDCTPFDAIQWVCEATRETIVQHDIDVWLIVSINRHEGVELAEEVAQAVYKCHDQSIVALDLAGLEAGYSASAFRDVFRKARENGLHVTLHAGEWEGAQSVWDAVGNVGAERIGHGIHVIEDPGVVQILRDRGIVLEVCPSSNVDSGAVTSIEQHPLRKLIDSNLLVTINTDDPLISGITLSDEIYRTMERYELTLENIKQHTLIAARSAFLPSEKRSKLVTKFEEWLSQ